MELKYDNIHEYTIKCSNTTQITLDDDYNVPDSKADIDSIIKDFGYIAKHFSNAMPDFYLLIL